MRVLLVGCGRVGRAIARHLIKKLYLKNLFLYDRSITNSMRLAHDLKSKKVRVVLEIKKVNNPNYVIIALSNQSDTSRLQNFNTKTTHQARLDELPFNIGEIKQLAKSLKKICKNSKIIVVTNPVDEFTNYLRNIMDYNDVVGFGASLDALRYSRYLKKKVLCIGEHGKAIPLLGLKTIKDYENLRREIDRRVVKVMNEEGMTHKMVGKEFSVFFDKLNDRKGTSVLVATYLLKKSFLGVKDIAIAIPFNVKKGKIFQPVDVKVSSLERKLFLEEAEELRLSIGQISG
jgi:malate/lactate dehydrogenase